MKDEKKVKQGKKNRAAGSAWELRVRKDLESKGWIVDKWTNNVEFGDSRLLMDVVPKVHKKLDGTWSEPKPDYPKLIPSKRKYAGPGRPMAIGTGFPDFIAFIGYEKVAEKLFETNYSGPIGVEAKTNGYLTPKEKEKCRWLLENKIFSRILIASKEKIKNRVHVKYTEFKI